MSVRVSLIGALLALAAPALALAESRTLYIQPLGDPLPADDLAMIEDVLTQFYGATVLVLPVVELPAEAWYAPRHRYRAEKLCAWLADHAPNDTLRILGVTSADISSTKGKILDWGLMGLGRLDGLSAVISTFRCKRTASSVLQARQRFGKVAVHEIGHTLGLEHCRVPSCMMHDAEGKVGTADREYDLCGYCRLLLEQRGRIIPSSPRIPWPNPWR